MSLSEEEIRRIVREEYRKIQNEDNEARTKQALAFAEQQKDEILQAYFYQFESEVERFVLGNKRYPDSDELKRLQKAAHEITWL